MNMNKNITINNKVYDEVSISIQTLPDFIASTKSIPAPFGTNSCDTVCISIHRRVNRVL